MNLLKNLFLFLINNFIITNDFSISHINNQLSSNEIKNMDNPDSYLNESMKNHNILQFIYDSNELSWIPLVVLILHGLLVKCFYFCFCTSEEITFEDNELYIANSFTKNEYIIYNKIIIFIICLLINSFTLIYIKDLYKKKLLKSLLNIIPILLIFITNLLFFIMLRSVSHILVDKNTIVLNFHEFFFDSFISLGGISLLIYFLYFIGYIFSYFKLKSYKKQYSNEFKNYQNVHLISNDLNNNMLYNDH
jgi:hypothetical protein